MPTPNQGHSLRRRVTQVADMIGRDSARRDIIEEVIRSFDEKTEIPNYSVIWPPWPQNKREKVFARSLGQALKKLEDRFNRLARKNDGDAERALIERAVFGERSEFFEWQDQLKHWRERVEAFAGTRQPEINSLFPTTTRWALGTPKPSKPELKTKHKAVKAAAEILERHKIRLSATRKSHNREGSEASLFCRVAAVIYGKPRSSLYHQCRVFIEARNRASK